MSDYFKIPTTREVWAAVMAAHPDMVVFSSYSAPGGDQFNVSNGRMFTSYGFNGNDYPIIEAETTWEIDPVNSANRINETHEYWLCSAREDDS